LIRTIDTNPEVEATEGSEEEGTRKRFWSWYEGLASADDDLSNTSRWAVAWDVHTDDVIAKAREITQDLPLPEGEKTAVIVAARFHDLGKKRIVWQRSIGNRDRTRWLAKSGRTRGGMMKPIELTDYRHEFGSLLDVVDQLDFQALNEAQRDLVLHLIAVHHGRARPHFLLEEGFDPERPQPDADRVASEVPQRFARLQRRYGRWGLAYLESLLRAADYAASVRPSRTLEDEP
jgi:CRISPR-associated endonuclease/helicase Cas3